LDRFARDWLRPFRRCLSLSPARAIKRYSIVWCNLAVIRAVEPVVDVANTVATG